MILEPSQPDLPLLARHEGDSLLTAHAAIVKGLLEAEVPVALVAGPRAGAFAPIFRLGSEEASAQLLRDHELRLSPTPTAARGLDLAQQTARSGRNAIALVPNDRLAESMSALRRARTETLSRGGALCVLLEDAPATSPELCPARLATLLDLPALAPADVSELRDMLEAALRLSRAGRCAIGLVVHTSVLLAAQTVEMRPNRAMQSVDAILARRRRRRRRGSMESRDVLRMVRRLELNRSRGLPSPGERTPVGFVAVGAAAPALAHLTHGLHLVGRVATLELGAIHPIDDSAVSRLLSRCAQVVVVEPRPGAVEARVLQVAEAMRQRGERPGTIWGRVLPPDDADDAEEATGIGFDEAVHPSRLARRIAHLLHRIRPGEGVGAQLVPTPLVSEPAPPARGLTVGTASALAIVRRLLVDVDQWLREREHDGEDETIVPTALAIDGALPEPAPPRTVIVETWDPVRFVREGIGAIRQAAREERPWVLIVCDVGGEDAQDLERLARGVVPAESADRVRIETANLADSGGLVELLRGAAVADRMTTIIVRDGPPPVCDVAAIERARAEVDRLGFEPRQRMTGPVERSCAFREPVEDEVGPERSELEQAPLESQVRVTRLGRRHGRSVRLRVRPLLEQVEVRRSRPPARRWRRDPGSRLALPEIVHRQSPAWRAHIAAFGGPAPGWTARILANAGRRMGYSVSLAYDPTPLAPGRRAWAELLYTRPRPGESKRRLSTLVPFGEADLLLGLDAIETLRAIESDPSLRVAHVDRTGVVVNTGRFGDETRTAQSRALRARLVETLAEVTKPEPRLVENFAGACRAWFHSERVVNVALLGAAFQVGLIPVSLDALEGAVADAEAGGFGRAMEALQFGRHLAADRRLFAQPKHDRAEDVTRIVRRMGHHIGRGRLGRSHAGASLRRVIERSLEAMPGLVETDPGRQARRDFVAAVYRCHHWGGAEYAERYARLVTELYRADRGEAGRALTRTAILPLAAATLIRDPVYVASMTGSGEHRRGIRQTLNVKRARGDEVRRRYLTRIELIAFGRRFRADLRTSDWPALIVAAARNVLPHAWRGTGRERALRTYLVNLVERAIAAGPEQYEHFQRALSHLHQQAVDDRLRGMTIAEVRMLAEGGGGDGA